VELVIFVTLLWSDRSAIGRATDRSPRRSPRVNTPLQAEQRTESSNTWDWSTVYEAGECCNRTVPSVG